MQTFLPYPSFTRSAGVLDHRRLGKQRVEALQILRALHLDGYGWANHPAVLMWRGHTRALVAYGLAMVEEWSRRGYADTTWPNITEFAQPQPAVREAQLAESDLPPWLGWPELHRSHRAALVRKDPAAYRAAFPDAPPELPYVWPQPPADPPAEAPITAWVVRAPTPRVLKAFRARNVVGLPSAYDRASPKRRRQAERLRAVAKQGDVVLVPDGDRLLRARLTGAPDIRLVAGERYLLRAVTWDTTLPRTALRQPYQLQDPQLLFPLRGEHAVAG